MGKQIDIPALILYADNLKSGSDFDRPGTPVPTVPAPAGVPMEVGTYSAQIGGAALKAFWQNLG